MADKGEDMNFNIKLVDETQQTPRVEDNGNSYPQPYPSLSQKQQIKQQNKYDLSAAAHPLACVATFSFKLGAFLCYLFLNWVLPDVSTFIVVVLFSAVDFWVVKNVTGRLLVGLRWWSDFDQDGKEIWKFESYDREYQANTVDTAFFWTSQIGATLLWVLFLFLNVITFSIFWSLLVFISTSLTATNLYGYYKCRKEYSKKLQDLKKQWAQKGLVHIAGKII